VDHLAGQLNIAGCFPGLEKESSLGRRSTGKVARVVGAVGLRGIAMAVLLHIQRQA
jgi:hypothetical protein